MKLKQIILCIVSLLSVSTAFAVAPISTSSTSEATIGVDNGYGGLKWTFDGGFIPAVVVGYRHAEVTSNGYAQGADISFAFNIFNGFQPGKLRVKYFTGADYIQGEVGGGYDFGKGAFFAGIGGNAPFSNFGADYNFGVSNPLEPYFALDSLGQYSKPRAHVTSSQPIILNAPIQQQL